MTVYSNKTIKNYVFMILLVIVKYSNSRNMRFDMALLFLLLCCVLFMPSEALLSHATKQPE